MKAIDALLREHRVIMRCLELLSVAANKVVRSEGPPRIFFDEAVVFCREFADKAHHYKEEYVLFGLLAQKKDGRLDAEIERHRSQHEHCRNLVSEIAAALDGYAEGIDASTRALHLNVTEYVATLTSHIRSENEIFFPMAAEAMTEEDDQHLMAAFREYEKSVPDDFHQQAERRVDVLSEKL